jgi:hypothetical protein
MFGERLGLRKCLAAIVAIYLLMLAGLIRWHASYGPPYHQPTIGLLISLGVCAALVGLLTIWGTIGALAWPKRGASFIVGAALISGFWLLFNEGNQYWVWQLVVMCATESGCVMLIVGSAGVLGYRLKGKHPDLGESPSPGTVFVAQFSLRDMIGITTALALLLTVLRVAEPINLGRTMNEILVLGGCTAGFVSTVALWGVLGKSHVTTRILALLSVAPLGGAAYAFASRYLSLLFDWQWYAGVTTIQLLFMAVPFWVIRAHGYRLTRVRAPE